MHAAIRILGAIVSSWQAILFLPVFAFWITWISVMVQLNCNVVSILAAFQVVTATRLHQTPCTIFDQGLSTISSLVAWPNIDLDKATSLSGNIRAHLNGSAIIAWEFRTEEMTAINVIIVLDNPFDFATATALTGMMNSKNSLDYWTNVRQSEVLQSFCVSDVE